MGEVVFTAPDGQALSFEIAGDSPSPYETIRIKKAIRNYSSKLDVSRPKSNLKKETEQLFDTKSGIQNATLRAALSGAETADEEEKQLQEL